MPIFQLTDKIAFPHPNLSDPDGILAIGGDLRAERLLLAYQHGIFPWYAKTEPIVWWSPDPRMVLFPEKLHISKSMKTLFNQQKFRVTFNRNFEAVLKLCAKPRPNQPQDGAWLHPEMIEAYKNLHNLGFAHSVEVWQSNQLVGGLYGVILGKCFFGESMFSKVNNASKYGFITLVKKLQKQQFKLIDCQIYTAHLESLGAELIDRDDFLELLAEYV